jgi:flagellar biosynthetic protein FlhB
MADQKTEQPTQKRLNKAREEGQFPSGRHFIGGVQFCVFAFLMHSQGGEWLKGAVVASRAVMKAAFRPEIDSESLLHLSGELLLACLVPLAKCGAVLVVVGIALQLGLTKLGVAPKKLMPNFNRLNPASKLKDLPKQNLPALLQALILIPVLGGAIYAMTRDQWNAFLLLPLANLTSGIDQVTGTLQSLLWKAAGVFLVFGCVEFFREVRRQSNTLKMTKQEIRDEMKESEGNPHIKAKIRALRRDQSRRNMMKAVSTATAVIVNPTHYAIALRYEPNSMVAPLVVAKGKNYLALRIKERAREHEIPFVENKPLAQALYKSVDVGQEIPPHLYRAVAEILAYVFKLMNRK